MRKDLNFLLSGVFALAMMGLTSTSSANTSNNTKNTGSPSRHPYFLTLNSLTDLKKLNPSYDGQIVTISYKLLSTDNAGGQFEWDATSTSTPDDALVVLSSVKSSGRWKRVITSNKYYTQWWSLVASGADQSALINKMIASLPSSATLTFEANKIYNISNQVIIFRPMTLIGNNTSLIYKGATTNILSIRSSYVTVSALNITGDGTLYAGGYMIAVEKGTNDRFYTNVTVQNCTLKNYKHTAIWMRYVKNFKILNNTISDFPYGGIIVCASLNGLIDNNKISNITGKYTTQNNCYGIQAARGQAPDSTCSDIMISNNTVTSVPWEGIDTHGGKNLTIYNNKVYKCTTGIAMVSSGDLAPKNCSVKNNYVEFLNTVDGTGIQFDGLSSSNPATGLISYNTVKGYGIKISKTRGIIIVGNTIDQSNQAYGITLKEYNALTSVTLNKIIDVWGPTSNNTAAIKFWYTNNEAYIDGNTLVSGSFVVPSGSKNRFGFRPNNEESTNRAIFASNNFSAATYKEFDNAGCATFNVNSGSIRTLADASYSVGTGVKFIVYSALTTSKLLTLPSASGNPGRILYVRHAGSGTVTLDLSTDVKKAANGSLVSTLTFKNQCSLISDGKYWWTMTQNF